MSACSVPASAAPDLRFAHWIFLSCKGGAPRVPAEHLVWNSKNIDLENGESFFAGTNNGAQPLPWPVPLLELRARRRPVRERDVPSVFPAVGHLSIYTL